jgi:hypothetical protein
MKIMTILTREDCIPKIPYRAMTKEESEKVWEYARTLDSKDQDKFWEQTIPEAREILRQIGGAGFVLGGELSWGNDIDGYGVHSHIYSKTYDNKSGRVETSCDRDKVIGSVDLWESGGFTSNPVQVWYENPAFLEEAIGLRYFFLRNNIPFSDSVNLSSLNREISRLEKEAADKKKVFDRLSQIELKK